MQMPANVLVVKTVRPAPIAVAANIVGQVALAVYVPRPGAITPQVRTMVVVLATVKRKPQKALQVVAQYTLKAIPEKTVHM